MGEWTPDQVFQVPFTIPRRTGEEEPRRVSGLGEVCARMCGEKGEEEGGLGEMYDGRVKKKSVRFGEVCGGSIAVKGEWLGEVYGVN